MSCDDATVPTTESLVFAASVFEGRHNPKVISGEKKRWASIVENLELMQEERRWRLLGVRSSPVPM